MAVLNNQEYFILMGAVERTLVRPERCLFNIVD